MSAIAYEKRDRIAYVTIRRPEAMNALGPAHNQEIIEAWTDFRDDPDVWVAILTGSGERAFCAGADLKTYTPSIGSGNPYTVRQVEADYRRGQRLRLSRRIRTGAGV